MHERVTGSEISRAVPPASEARDNARASSTPSVASDVAVENAAIPGEMPLGMHTRPIGSPLSRCSPNCPGGMLPMFVEPARIKNM